VVVDAGVGFRQRWRGWLRVRKRVLEWLRRIMFRIHRIADTVYAILLATPEFCVKDAEEALVAGNALESCLRESGLRVG
jgi:hypothetical protein